MAELYHRFYFFFNALLFPKVSLSAGKWHFCERCDLVGMYRKNKMQSKPNQPCLCFWANKPSLEHLQVRSLVWQGLLQRSQDPTWHALKHFSSKGLGCYAKSSCDREETGRDEMFWLSIWWKWAFSFLASRRLLTRWSPKCMSELVSSERKTVLVFDWFFMRFVQRVTHVQNMSTSVYYGGLCVLPRRMFSLSVSMDLTELAFICGNVCSKDGREKAIRVHNIFSFFTHQNFETSYRSFLH